MTKQAPILGCRRESRVQELPHHDHRVIQRQNRHLPYLHHNCDLLRHQGRAQNLRVMQPVFRFVAQTPHPHGHASNADASDRLVVSHAVRYFLHSREFWGAVRGIEWTILATMSALRSPVSTSPN
ncbi:hypothetical protein [Thioalkalivibrio sp. K90mix]|jgi:hypothetical protein|uniref:hypothetical protein n=1 Tax=Thioalkalivibrio sp. (strain K90mix) TaxID=396595 RepID=UPI0011D1145A|nr:hypothetical protein [Thioalkalivibrio sp. K90mix]